MIDFQKGGLEYQVYELIVKMCALVRSEVFPCFQTKRTQDGKWECTLEIPGITEVAKAKQDSEVESINRCASNMLFILDCIDRKGFYDPDIVESVFRDRIEEAFGEVKYDPKYLYYPCSVQVPISPYNKGIASTIKQQTVNVESKNGDIVQQVDSVLLVKFLMRRKKKKWC